jgi:hypothetical protein
VCAFVTPPNALAGSLHLNPEIAPGSVRYVDAVRSADLWYALQFTYAPGNAAPQAMLLTTDREHYTLSYDWRVSLSWLTLGEAIIALGSPDTLTRHGADITLRYPARRLFVVIRPALLARQHSLRLTPGEPVIALQMPRDPVTDGTNALYSSAPQAWRGFGVYTFQD